MKKQKLCALLCAAMMLASSLPAFAANPVLEEPPVEPMGPAEIFEIPYAPLHFVDKEGNPVQGLVFSELTLNHFTDANGLNEIDVGAATGLYDGGYSGEQKVDFSKPVVFSVTNPVNGDMKKYNVLLDDDKTTKLVWDKETPTQSLEKKKEKVFFCAIDQNGNPITDAQFVLPALQALASTDSAGKTWYSGMPFEKQTVTLYYSDSYGNRRNTSKIVTIEDSHLQNGKMGITFQVTV